MNTKNAFRKFGTDKLEKLDVDGNQDPNGVVYKLTCLKCEKLGKHASYVGETGRQMSKRLSNDDPSSSVMKVHHK